VCSNNSSASQNGVGHDVAPRPRAHAAPARRALSVRGRALPEASSARGRRQPQAVQLPRPHTRAGVRARAPRMPCRAGRMPPPLVRRSVRDLRPSCVVLRPGHHTVITIGRAVPLFKRSPLLLAPPDLAPAVPQRRRGRRRQAIALHRLLVTERVSSIPRTRSTSPSHTLPSVRAPLAGTPSCHGRRRRPSPCAHASDSSAPTTATSRP
jgi:hypothetical protein